VAEGRTAYNILIPWQGGKPLTWDVTVVSTPTASYLSSFALSAGVSLVPQQTSLPVVKRRNIWASPTRIFSSPSRWSPMRSVQFFSCHFGRTLDRHLRRLEVERDLCTSFKDSRSQYNGSIWYWHTRVFFCRRTPAPLASLTFDFRFLFLSLGIFTTEGDEKINLQAPYTKFPKRWNNRMYVLVWHS